MVSKVIIAINPDGTDVQRLSSGRAAFLVPRRAEHRFPQQRHLRVMNADGSGKQRLAVTSAVSSLCSLPVWADGLKIGFMSGYRSS